MKLHIPCSIIYSEQQQQQKQRKNQMTLIEAIYNLRFVYSVQSERQIEIKSTDFIGCMELY